MHKLAILNPEITKDMINFQIAETAETRYLHRLHGILFILNGKSCYEVSSLLGHSPRTIEYWVKKVNEKGLIGLQEKERPGRPSAVSDEQRKILKDDLCKHPRSLGYDHSNWDGKLLSFHIFKKFKLNLKVRQCQRLFHQLGFSLQRPRQKLTGANEKQRQIFKKDA